ncbi:hypothetical protein AB1N83_013647 [Pleurotus pulmonarius]
MIFWSPHPRRASMHLNTPIPRLFLIIIWHLNILVSLLLPLLPNNSVDLRDRSPRLSLSIYIRLWDVIEHPIDSNIPHTLPAPGI